MGVTKSTSIQQTTLWDRSKSFIYLGGQIDKDGTCQNDVKRRIGLALGAMHALHPIWRAKDISNQTKIALFRSLVLSTALYAAETWTLRQRDQERPLSFEMSYLRRILGISRRDRIRNDNIRQKLDLKTTIMHSRRLTYYGHVTRMCNNRLPLKTLFGTTNGTRPKQGQIQDMYKEGAEIQKGGPGGWYNPKIAQK